MLINASASASASICIPAGLTHRQYSTIQALLLTSSYKVRYARIAMHVKRERMLQLRSPLSHSESVYVDPKFGKGLPFTIFGL